MISSVASSMPSSVSYGPPGPRRQKITVFGGGVAARVADVCPMGRPFDVPRAVIDAFLKMCGGRMDPDTDFMYVKNRSQNSLTFRMISRHRRLDFVVWGEEAREVLRDGRDIASHRTGNKYVPRPDVSETIN